jgi:hypothetical protein
MAFALDALRRSIEHNQRMRLSGPPCRVASDWHTVASFSSDRIAKPFQYRTEAISPAPQWQGACHAALTLRVSRKELAIF